MTKKELAYKELCEMGKLGMYINFPKCFRVLEHNFLDSDFANLSTSEIVDLCIESD